MGDLPSAAGLPAAPSSGTGTAAPHTERNLPPPSPRSPLIPAVTTGPSSQQVGNSRKSQGREAWGLVPTCLGPSRTQKGLHDGAGTRNDPMAAQLGTVQQVLSQLKPTREHPGQQEKLWAAPAPDQQRPQRSCSGPGQLLAPAAASALRPERQLQHRSALQP